MELRFLNCGTMYPRVAPMFSAMQDRSCCICLLIETGNGLVLVDTGFGTADMQDLGRLATPTCSSTYAPTPSCRRRARSRAWASSRGG